MADAPAWARHLVHVVCREAGLREPRLRWRVRGDRPNSAGMTRQASGSVSVTAGTDPVDQRLTLLHELAHWLGPMPARRAHRARARLTHHDAAFYARAFDLYRRFGIPHEAALRGEAARYPSVLRHARALRVPGAEEVWREHRRELRERSRELGPMRVVVPEHRVRLVRDGRWSRCAVCGVRVVGPTLRRFRRRGGRHVLLARG